MTSFLVLLLLIAACSPPPPPPPPPPLEPYKVIRFLTDQLLEPNMGMSFGQYQKIEGYGHVNIHVQFSQAAGDEPPVDLGFMFAFDSVGTMASRRYVDLETSVTSPQHTNFIEISGAGSWHGEQGISSYSVRSPVMGPYLQVFLYNRANLPRHANVWAYLTP